MDSFILNCVLLLCGQKKNFPHWLGFSVLNVIYLLKASSSKVKLVLFECKCGIHLSQLCLFLLCGQQEKELSHIGWNSSTLYLLKASPYIGWLGQSFWSVCVGSAFCSCELLQCKTKKKKKILDFLGFQHLITLPIIKHYQYEMLIQ